MKNISKFVLSGAMVLSFVFAPAVQAATLTTAQVSAIVSLLQAFGASASVTANVTAALGGAPVVTTTPVTTSANAPVISYLSTSQGNVGQYVTIYGKNFDRYSVIDLGGCGNTKGDTLAYSINDFSYYSTLTALTFVVPNAPVGMCSLAVVEKGGTGVSNSVNFTITGGSTTVASTTTASITVSPNLDSTSPAAQNVIAGTTAPIAVYDVTSSGGNSTITEMDFSVTSNNASITSVTAGGVTASNVGNSIILTGLNIIVPQGYAGVSIPVTATYGQIGQKGTTASVVLTLTSVKSSTNTVNVNIPSSTMTVVASSAPTPTTLTTSQINAVVSLLNSFGVSSATASYVQAILSGQSASAPTSGQNPLTQSQVNAIISLLQSFGASQSIVTAVQAALPVQTATPTVSLADLIPTQIIYNTTGITAGQQVHFQSGFTNQGGTDSGIFNAKWFVDGVQVGYGSTRNVPAGATDLTGNSGYTWTAVSGTHTIQFVVNPDGIVNESNTSNNSISVTVTVPGATQVSSITVSPNLVSTSPVSQYVVGGSTFPVAVYNVVSSVASSQITEMDFTTDANNTITSVTVGGMTAPVVAGTATLTGLNIIVPAGLAGTNIPVSVTYNTVGPNALSTDGLTSNLTLTKVKSPANTVNVSIAANPMYLVASKPTVSVVGATTVLSGQPELIDVTVAADGAGDIALNQLPLSVSLTGTGLSIASQQLVVKVNGNTLAPSVYTNTASVGTNSSATTNIVFTGGYRIAAGTSVTFQVFAAVNGYTGTAQAIQTRLDVPTNFKWADVNGGGSNLDGSHIVGYPTNTVTVASVNLNTNQSQNVASVLSAIPQNDLVQMLVNLLK